MGYFKISRVIIGEFLFRPVYVNVALKHGQKIRSAVLEKLGRDIIGHLVLEDDVDPTEWDFDCVRDEDKQYIADKIKERTTEVTDTSIRPSPPSATQAVAANLVECLIK